MSDRNITHGNLDRLPALTKSDGVLPASDDSAQPALELAPSLGELVRSAGLNPYRLTVAFETDGNRHIRIAAKQSIAVSDGHKIATWAVPSLHELFRGSRMPPADIDHYPPEYCPHFFFVENQVLTLSDAMGDRTDQELEEIYSALRRRPDGRSLGVAHDFIWQVAALLLGRHVLSASEFEALLGALARSTRKWGLRPVSRNYIGYLRNTFGGAHASRVAR